MVATFNLFSIANPKYIHHTLNWCIYPGKLIKSADESDMKFTSDHNFGRSGSLCSRKVSDSCHPRKIFLTCTNANCTAIVLNNLIFLTLELSPVEAMNKGQKPGNDNHTITKVEVKIGLKATFRCMNILHLPSLFDSVATNNKIVKKLRYTSLLMSLPSLDLITGTCLTVRWPFSSTFLHPKLGLILPIKKSFLTVLIIRTPEKILIFPFYSQENLNDIYVGKWMNGRLDIKISITSIKSKRFDIVYVTKTFYKVYCETKLSIKIRQIREYHGNFDSHGDNHSRLKQMRRDALHCRKGVAPDLTNCFHICSKQHFGNPILREPRGYSLFLLGKTMLVNQL
ncbi:hypothetical protein EGR_06685 [Echinococcus granulosus]|uniref:Uncharacterized protein n=1 Tax=Echinococcus granulosus TaxID=6210 RepID=W6UY66_ECHGR|nr:hypothetical protein EGR_06685 [Echinococcus granulosus]EUB58504.1 hypothetical protein EGR_06685 [Echinococcus granulosus]